MDVLLAFLFAKKSVCISQAYVFPPLLQDGRQSSILLLVLFSVV